MIYLEDIQKFHTVRGYQLLKQNKKLLTPAMEDYLEMIYRNSLTEKYIRINKLSEMLNVQAPSATKMVQKLTHLGLLDYKRYGIIFLTENGTEIGKFLLLRHNIIKTFFENLGVKDNLLVETELVEHNISDSTLQNMDSMNKFFKTNPDILKNFEKFKNTHKD